MRLLKPKRLNLIIFFIATLSTLSRVNPVVFAQEPSPFEISVVPLNEHAVSGQPFTYTVTITNVSQTPLETVFINVDVPEGTKFLRTQHLSQNWYGGSPDADPNIQIEELTLFSFEPVKPNEVFSFEMIVEILPETQEEIAIETFNSTTFTGNVLAAGASIKTEVQTPTPTSTPTPTPVPTSTPSPAATTAALRAADNAPTSTPIIPINSTETIIQSNPSREVTANPSLLITIIAGAGFLLLLVLGGSIWLLKRR